MKRYKGKYRNDSHRLKGWDYSGNGNYFITINTHSRECHFGDIVDGKMNLNDFGKIATDEWFKSFEIRIELSFGAFILMPNHLHAIIGLESGTTGLESETEMRMGTGKGRVPNENVPIETIPDVTNVPTDYPPQQITHNRNKPFQ